MIRCNKLSIATADANPDKYENDFDAVVAFLNQYIDDKVTTNNFYFESVSQGPNKKQKLGYYDAQNYLTMSNEKKKELECSNKNLT